MPILHWLNKDEPVIAARRSAYRLLQELPDLSYGNPDNDNLLIQGDNLEALKALIPFYSGKLSCIFIDPRYNTKSTFEHNDGNLEHSKWLALIYPRLELLSDFDLSSFFSMLENSKTVRTKPIITIKKMKIAVGNKSSDIIFVYPLMRTI